MNKFEQGPFTGETIYPKEVEEIALRAAEMPEFQGVVQEANSIFEAVKGVRVLLAKHFPEIPNLSDPVPPQEDVNAIRLKNPLGGVACNEHIIARHVVSLLWQKKK